MCIYIYIYYVYTNTYIYVFVYTYIYMYIYTDFFGEYVGLFHSLHRRLFLHFRWPSYGTLFCIPFSNLMGQGEVGGRGKGVPNILWWYLRLRMNSMETEKVFLLPVWQVARKEVVSKEWWCSLTPTRL